MMVKQQLLPATYYTKKCFCVCSKGDSVQYATRISSLQCRLFLVMLLTVVYINAFSLNCKYPRFRRTSLYNSRRTDILQRIKNVNPSAIDTQHCFQNTRISTTRLCLSPTNNNNNNVDWNSNDPYTVLGIASRSANKKEIKRAYKRLALQYHPDMVTDRTSSTAEKKIASDRFAKINWAYETLMNDAYETHKQTSSASSRGTSTQSDEWVPPHRRAGSYASSTSRTQQSTSSSRTSSPDPFNEDYYYGRSRYDSEYDAGGDSFGKIFSDLFSGAVTEGAKRGMSATGIFSDFVEFLEKNIDGYASSASRGVDGRSSADGDEAELLLLLRTGTVQEIGDEMDETELVVQQLTTKKQSMNNDLIMIQADLKIAATTYGEKLDLQRQVDELQARIQVIDTYLKKARQRLFRLQTKYKDFIVSGADDPKTRETSATTWDNIKRESKNAAPGTSATSAGRSAMNTAPSSSSSSATAVGKDASNNDSWKYQSFGSFSRGRGSSSRSHRRSEQRPSQDTTSGSYSTDQRSSSTASDRFGSSYDDRTYRSESIKSNNYDVPPHRRKDIVDNFGEYKRKEEDKKRLREIKADEEFEKLKKELGLM